jgi:methyl-accepting chemotaxis protein
MLHSSAMILSGSFSGSEFKEIAGLRDAVRGLLKMNSTMLYAAVYKKTSDENYFRALIAEKGAAPVPIEIVEGQQFKENKDVNYLGKGLLEPAVDPGLYSEGGFHWQNIYFPVKISGADAVAQLFVSSAVTSSDLERQGASLIKFTVWLAVCSVLLVLFTAAAGWWFYHNQAIFINGLSDSMRRAAAGDMNVSLNEMAADRELAPLASSFNELIEEFREAKNRPVPELPELPEAPPAAPDTSELFREGVALLKEGRNSEAAGIFRSVTFIKPEGYAGFFNLGVARARGGEYSSARTAFQRSIELNPDHEQSAKYLERVKDIPDRNP